MIDVRIGIIGSTHGVNAQQQPKAKERGDDADQVAVYDQLREAILFRHHLTFSGA